MEDQVAPNGRAWMEARMAPDGRARMEGLVSPDGRALREDLIGPDGRALIEGRVVWVVDGDTIHVRVGARLERVRYIGINTPEIPHERRWWREGGALAHAANRQLVARQAAALELDVERRDDYGRLLAYVWVAREPTPAMADATPRERADARANAMARERGRVMANAELVRQGFARVMAILPNVKHRDLLLALQREAREARRGLWRRA